MSNVKTSEIPTLDAQPEARLRKVPADVSEIVLSILTRGVALKLATQGEMRPCTPKLYGAALGEIVAEWMAREVVRLSAKGA